MDSYSVRFAGNDLSLIENVELYNHNFNDLPERDVRIFKVARRDLSIITSSEYSAKNIPVFLEVCGSSREATEETLTFLKSLVQAQNQPLVVSQSGQTIEYTATMNEFNIEWDAYKAYVQINFITSNPIGRQTQAVTGVSVSGNTLVSRISSFTVEGSATAFPSITVVINSVTGGTGGSIVLENARTNQGITITEDFVNGDILIVNSATFQVTLNGVQLDFSGMFPQFPAGSQQVRYSDNFTTRNVDITLSYNPRFV